MFLGHATCAAELGFLLDSMIETLSQVATVFIMPNWDIHTTVPGVRNRAQAEDIVGCVDLGYIPQAHSDL